MHFIHAMLRVAELERSLDFYMGALDMTLFHREAYPTGRFTLDLRQRQVTETQRAISPLLPGSRRKRSAFWKKATLVN